MNDVVVFSKAWRATVGFWRRFRTPIISAALSSLVSIAASGFISSYISNEIGKRYNEALENKKNTYASIFQQKGSFDTSQNSIYAELGLFTGQVLDGKKPIDSTKVESAIIQAQLQLGQLQDALGVKSRSDIIVYGDALNDLKKSIEDVKSPSDLEGVYAVARKILTLHDKLDRQVDSQLHI